MKGEAGANLTYLPSGQSDMCSGIDSTEYLLPMSATRWPIPVTFNYNSASREAPHFPTTTTTLWHVVMQHDVEAGITASTLLPTHLWDIPRRLHLHSAVHKSRYYNQWRSVTRGDQCGEGVRSQ